MTPGVLPNLYTLSLTSRQSAMLATLAGLDAVLPDKVLLSQAAARILLGELLRLTCVTYPGATSPRWTESCTLDGLSRKLVRLCKIGAPQS